MVLDCMFYSKRDWNIRYTPKALRKARIVKLACLFILFGLTFQGMRQPEGYFGDGELLGRAVWSLSNVPQLLTKCTSSVLSQGISFVGVFGRSWVN